MGVDSKTGLVHTVKVTAANVHNVTVMSDLLTGEETFVYRDSGYTEADKRGNVVEKTEYQKSSVRANVEYVFGVVKKLFKYRKTRYRGIVKQTQKMNMMFALANIYLANKKTKLA